MDTRTGLNHVIDVRNQLQAEAARLRSARDTAGLLGQPTTTLGASAETLERAAATLSTALPLLGLPDGEGQA